MPAWRLVLIGLVFLAGGAVATRGPDFLAAGAAVHAQNAVALPASHSPEGAIDAGNDSAVGPPLSLATGPLSQPRPQEAHRDIGAYEIESLPPGDCNGDTLTDAGDISAVVLEIFDSDGTAPPYGGGAFPGTAGCDANEDGTADAGDVACIVLIIFGALSPCGQQPLQAMQVERAFPNLTFVRLTNLVQPADGVNHILVTEQRGRILVFPNDQQAAEAAIFLDITGRVSEASNEEGLLGLAFHPEYQSNGYFYVYYSAAQPTCSASSRCSVVSRFSVSQNNPNLADPDSELVIMEIGQPEGNHNAGQLAFGPDGYLYIALGDGGSGGGPAQNLGSLLGSILRIDVDGVSESKNYRIPPGNPFAGVAGARDEIWAYGFRNPWRFSFDWKTGRLWAADVGQRDWEEVDIVEEGLNYGWNIMEGFHCFSPPTGCDQTGLELPIVEYDHVQGCSVTGGFVFRGKGLPSLLGAYIYGDFCSGNIWGLRYDGASVTEQLLLADTSLLITSFGEDMGRNLYILSRTGGIYRLVPAGQSAS